MEPMDVVVETAYTTYVTAMGGMDVEHRPLPPYADLPVAQKQAWREALLAALPLAEIAPPATAGARVPPSAPAVHITQTTPPAAAVPPAAPDAEDEEPHRRGGRK